MSGSRDRPNPVSEIYRSLRLVLALAMASMSVVSLPGRVVACSCPPARPPAEALATAESVFVGVAHNGVDRSTESGRSEIEFEVEHAWKGVEGRRIVVSTANSGGACGLDFAKDRRYVVYAYIHAGKLGTGLCTRTAELSRAGEDIAYLETLTELQVPTDVPLSSLDGRGDSGQLGESQQPSKWTVILVLVILALPILLLWIRRRKALDDHATWS